MAAASEKITIEEFKDALSRYPSILKKYSGDADSSPSLEQLDQFRYIDAPAQFSKQTGNVLKLEDIKKLTSWKLKHGKFRPSLSNLVASNTDETVAEATSSAFQHYSSNSSDVAGTLNLLSKPLKGVGPATASLYLAIHDPTKIIFFSDEAYKWLVDDKKLTYNVKEYEALHKANQGLMERLSVSPIEIEKVAFVLIKENESEKPKASKKASSEEPREKLSRSAKEPKPEPVVTASSAPAKRKRSASKSTAGQPSKKRGRPAKEESNSDEPPKKRGRPSKDAEDSAEPPKKRGRPSGASAEKSKSSAAPSKRGRPAKSSTEASSAASKPRGRPAKSAAEKSISSAATKGRGRPAVKKSTAASASTTGKKRGRPPGAKK